jgi:subtilisin family serine protease
MRLSWGLLRHAPSLAILGLAGCAPDGTGAEAARAASYLTEAQALVGMDEVRGEGWTGAGITVALIDTGIDSSHPDLAGRVVDEACFCGTGCCPGGGIQELGAGSALDDHGHGTHVAGIVASQGGSSPLGGAPGVELVAVKVLDDNLGFCCMSDVVDALAWIATSHPEVDVVNLSLGASALYPGDCDALNTVLGLQVDALRAAGTLVVAASGNDGSAAGMRAPACIASAISVGAVWDADVGAQSQYCSEPTTAADQIACYSNASGTTDLLAPGGVIASAWPGGASHMQSGTSEAAPIVTACVAALRQAAPSASPDALEAVLEQTGAPRFDARNGLTYPRVDCAAALRALLPDGDEDGGVDEDHDAGAASDASAGASAGAGTGGSAAGAAERDAEAEGDAASPGGGRGGAASADDAGTRDGGARGSEDAGTVADAGGDAGGAREEGAGGCACGVAESARGDVAVVAVMVALAIRARRRRGLDA